MWGGSHCISPKEVEPSTLLARAYPMCRVRRRQVALAHRLIELLAGGSMALLFDPRGFQLQEVIEVELLLIQVVAELPLKLVGGTTIAKVFTDDLRPLGEEVGRLRRAMHLLSVMQIDEVSIQLALVPQLVEIIGGEGMGIVVVVAGTKDIGGLRCFEGGHRHGGQRRGTSEGAQFGPYVLPAVVTLSGEDVLSTLGDVEAY